MKNELLFAKVSFFRTEYRLFLSLYAYCEQTNHQQLRQIRRNKNWYPAIP